MGLWLVLHLDDGICFAESCKPALTVSQILQPDLKASGVIVNREKSQFDSSQSGRRLGYGINLKLGTLSQHCGHLIESIQELMVVTDNCDS